MRDWQRVRLTISGQRWAVVPAALAAAAAVLWLAARIADSSVIERRAIAAADREPPLAWTMAGPRESVDPEEVPPAPNEPPSAGTERVEVCGAGWVEARADGSIDLDGVMARPAFVEARERLLRSLEASGGIGEGAALVLELGRLPARHALAACQDGQCSVAEADRAEVTGLVGRLAALATVTTDPRLYGLAWQACQPAVVASACGLLSAAQWARLDGGNGLPWMQALDEAHARADRAAVDEALFHMGSATRFELRPFSIASVVASHAGPTDVDLAVAAQLAEESLAQSAPLPPLQSLLRVCTVPALADSNRRQTCERVAENLAERSDTLATLRVGNAIGRRLGWTDDRLDRADIVQEAASDALPAVPDSAVPEPRRPAVRAALDCDAAGAVLDRFRRHASGGETGAVREWLARAGNIAPYRRLARERRASRIEREQPDGEAPLRVAAAAVAGASSGPGAAPGAER